MSLVEETREELNHVHQMLHVLRNRLRERQVQAARYGYDVPPQVATEIKDLERDIKFYEDKRELLDRVVLEHSMRPKQSKKNPLPSISQC